MLGFMSFFCKLLCFILKGRKYEVFFGGILSYQQDYHLLAYSIQETYSLNTARSW